MKKLSAAFFAFLIAFQSFAVGVNEPELQSTGGEEVIKFENYNGPHSVIETAAQISAIGRGLGNMVSSDVNLAATYGSGAKYSVIHAIDPSEKGKLDADILIINAKATVDHIKNLRRIIASYLSAAYGYSAKDAQTVATFVTVYNAVYRGKMDIFESKYKKKVTSNLSADKCGLSTKWSEWPGKSQIVIPLNDLEGGLSTVDTSVISDKNVVGSMQEEDNKGVDERKNMVDIKEREAEKATEKANEASKKAEQAKEEQKKAEDKAKAKEAEAAKAQKEAVEKAKEAAKNPNDAAAQKEADSAQKAADEKAEEAQEARAEAEEVRAEAEEAQKKADDAYAEAEKKQGEADEERNEIAKDQQEIISKALNEAKDGNTVVGLKVTDSATRLSAMVRVNSETGETLKESPVTVIRGRTIIPVSGAVLDGAASKATEVTGSAVQIDTSLLYMAICGENTGLGAVKLCLLDAYLMEIQKESAETVAEDSVLVEKDGEYFCVIEDNGNNVLAKFDKNLTMKTKSSVNLNPATPVTITERGIIVTTAENKTVLLKASDLTAVTQQNQQQAPAAADEAQGYAK